MLFATGIWDCHKVVLGNGIPGASPAVALKGWEIQFAEWCLTVRART